MKEASGVVSPSYSNHSTSHHLALTRAVPLALMVVLLAAPAPVRGALTWSANNSFGSAVVNGFNDEATIRSYLCVSENLFKQGIVTDIYQAVYHVAFMANEGTMEFGGRFHVRGSGTAQTFDVWVLATLGDDYADPPPANGSLVAQIRKVSAQTSGYNATQEVQVVNGSTTNFYAQPSGQWYDTCWHHAYIELPTPPLDDGDYWFTVTWAPAASDSFLVMVTDQGSGDVLGIGWPIGGQSSWSETNLFEPMIVIEQGPTTPPGGVRTNRQRLPSTPKTPLGSATTSLSVVRIRTPAFAPASLTTLCFTVGQSLNTHPVTMAPLAMWTRGPPRSWEQQTAPMIFNSRFRTNAA